MRASLCLAATLAATGCTLFVEGGLADAQEELPGPDGEGEAGEGEGDGGEGEGGEGEGGEGEGEGEGDVPGCEVDERILVLKDDNQDPLIAYRFTSAGLAPVQPSGYQPGDGAITDASDNPLEASFAALAVSGSRAIVSAGGPLFAIDTTTFTQVNLRGNEKLVSFVGSSTEQVLLTDGWIVTFGFGSDAIDRQTPFDVVREVSGVGDFHNATAFDLDGATLLAGMAEDGYRLFSATGSGFPASAGTIIDTGRFSDYGPSNYPRGIAFDTTTQTLLLGNVGAVVVAHASDSFALPSPSTDWLAPAGDVTALGARGGRGFAATNSGQNNLFLIELQGGSAQTLNAVKFGQTSVLPRDIVVGCNRVGVLAESRLYVFSADLNDPLGVADVADAAAIELSTKSALAIEGDD